MRVQESGPAPRGPVREEALLARLEALGTGHAAVPDEAFLAATRSRLVAMAAVRSPAGQSGVLRRLLASSGERPRRRNRLTAGVAGAALVLTAVGGVLAAAQGARPGDLLYEVKRGGEQTQLSLAADSARGHTLLDFATTRLREVGELAGVHVTASAAVGASGGEAGLAAGPDVGLIVDTLATMDAQTTQGTADLTSRAVEQQDGAAVEELIGWAGRQRSGLGELSPVVPADARDAVARAGRLVDDVAARGTALREALACPAGPATDGADALGPRPAPCAPVPAPPSAAPDGTTVASTAPGTAIPPPSGSPSPSATPPAGSTAARTTSGARPTLPTSGTAVPRPTTSGSRPALPTPTVPSFSVPVPSISAPSIPAPSLSLPSVPVPGGTVPVPSATASSGAAVQLPPLVPGVQLCIPPLVTVNCQPSGG